VMMIRIFKNLEAFENDIMIPQLWEHYNIKHIFACLEKVVVIYEYKKDRVREPDG